MISLKADDMFRKLGYNKLDEGLEDRNGHLVVNKIGYCSTEEDVYIIYDLNNKTMDIHEGVPSDELWKAINKKWNELFSPLGRLLWKLELIRFRFVEWLKDTIHVMKFRAHLK